MKKGAFIFLIAVFLASCASVSNNLTSSEEEFLSFVRYTITEQERQEFLSLAPASPERGRFIQDFWIKRDPTPGTPANEFRQTYFQRIEAANRLFRGGRPGWLTDRGMILILLGPPDDREDFPMGKTSEEKPSEIWTYHNLPNKPELRLEFVDYSNTNDYKLVTNISRESINSFVRQGMNLSDGMQSPTAAIASRKPPQDLKLEKIQETDKAMTKSQQTAETPEGEV
jgi:GWxTD domain-containing protein